MKKNLAFFLALGIFHAAFSQSKKYTLVITNANIVDVTSGKIPFHKA